MNINNKASRALPNGTKLPHNYIINDVLGEGGFGITYSGQLQITGEKVAIKEYFPSELAYRHNDSKTDNTIIPYTDTETSFKKGREHFRNEASILKEFQHLHSIVSVRDVIDANGTTYLIMEFINGITLKQYIKENGVLTYDELLSLITPIIQSLTQIHKKGLIHRDISPENIMVGTDNQLHLIDFGAARYENSNISKTITIILKSGYAPPEQYLSDGKQGAWTDIYALASTMYFALTSITPMDSIRRMQSDDLPSLVTLTPIHSWQAATIEKGMNISAALRFQNMETFYQALRIPPAERDAVYSAYLDNSIEENKTIMQNSNDEQKQKSHLIPKKLVIGTFIILIFIGISLIGSTLKPDNQSTDTKAPSKTVDSKEEAEEKTSPDSNAVTTEQSSVKNKTVKENTTDGLSSESNLPASTATDNSKNQITTEITTEITVEYTTENTTEATTEKQNLNVVPDDDDDYEVIHLK